MVKASSQKLGDHGFYSPTSMRVGCLCWLFYLSFRMEAMVSLFFFNFAKKVARICPDIHQESALTQRHTEQREKVVEWFCKFRALRKTLSFYILILAPMKPGGFPILLTQSRVVWCSLTLQKLGKKTSYTENILYRKVGSLSETYRHLV